MTKNLQKKSIFKKFLQKNVFMTKICKKKYISTGIRTLEAYALELESSPFDHSGTLTKKIFPPQGIEPWPIR